jgi:hypothetical protein
MGIGCGFAGPPADAGSADSDAHVLRGDEAWAF